MFQTSVHWDADKVHLLIGAGTRELACAEQITVHDSVWIKCLDEIS